MKYCRKENIRKNILGKVSISNSFFSRILSSLIRPLELRKMTCVQLRTMTNFNISKNMLCKVGISYSLCSGTVSLTIFLLIFANEIE